MDAAAADDSSEMKTSCFMFLHVGGFWSKVEETYPPGAFSGVENKELVITREV